MTIGLGAVSRSISESKTARQEVDSSQTFNAAEQLIEQALQRSLDSEDQISTINTTLNDALPGYSGTYTVAQQDTFVGTVLAGHSAQVNLKDYTGTLSLTWRDKGGCGKGNAALVVTLLNETQIERHTYGRNCGVRSDNFDSSNVTCVDSICKVANVNAAGFLLGRIAVVYADTELTVEGSSPLPTQSYKITSTATHSQEGSDAEARSVEVNRSLPSVPSVFDFAVFSGGSIVQKQAE